jgi:hypothetical protein
MILYQAVRTGDHEIYEQTEFNEDMVADIFTKGLTHSKHNFCVSGLGLVNAT